MLRMLDRSKSFCENIPPIGGGKYTQDGILFSRDGVEIPVAKSDTTDNEKLAVVAPITDAQPKVVKTRKPRKKARRGA